MPRDNGVLAEIDALQHLSLVALRLRWATLFGTTPAPRVSRDILIRGVAWRLQEEAYGGLSKSARRRLSDLATELGNHGTISPSRLLQFKPGTKLIREWKGKVHEIVICDDGYVWSGKRFRSLSEIARKITGTRWSGPRFFGLAGETQPVPNKSITRPTPTGTDLVRNEPRLPRG